MTTKCNTQLCPWHGRTDRQTEWKGSGLSFSACLFWALYGTVGVTWLGAEGYDEWQFVNVNFMVLRAVCCGFGECPWWETHDEIFGDDGLSLADILLWDGRLETIKPCWWHFKYIIFCVYTCLRVCAWICVRHVWKKTSSGIGFHLPLWDEVSWLCLDCPPLRPIML